MNLHCELRIRAKTLHEFVRLAGLCGIDSLKGSAEFGIRLTLLSGQSLERLVSGDHAIARITLKPLKETLQVGPRDEVLLLHLRFGGGFSCFIVSRWRFLPYSVRLFLDLGLR